MKAATIAEKIAKEYAGYRRAAASRIADLSVRDRTCRKYNVAMPLAALNVLDALIRDYDAPGSVKLDQIKALIRECEHARTEHAQTEAGVLASRPETLAATPDHGHLPWLAQRNALHDAQWHAEDLLSYWLQRTRTA